MGVMATEQSPATHMDNIVTDAFMAHLLRRSGLRELVHVAASANRDRMWLPGEEAPVSGHSVSTVVPTVGRTQAGTPLLQRRQEVLPGIQAEKSGGLQAGGGERRHWESRSDFV
jgi:hypothetical protein